MTVPFTPRFCDLVRTFTTTAGTGPIVPGAAVQGFSTFAEMLSAGEQFYYCMQGIDRPSEREIGRGTLEANGNIARDPVSGKLTEFSAGTKTVAVVAAAEWFGRLEKASKGSSPTAANRAALAAMDAEAGAMRLLTEPSREGIFVFRSGDQSARVGADPQQGLAIAAADDASGSRGAWLRQVEGAINPAWFGVAAGEGRGVANSAAWAAMCSVLRSRAADVSTYYQALERIRFPVGRFEFATTLELTDGTFVLEGEGIGHPARSGRC